MNSKYSFDNINYLGITDVPSLVIIKYNSQTLSSINYNSNQIYSES